MTWAAFAAITLALASCGSPGVATSPAGGPSAASDTALPTWPVPGNSAVAELPTDAPKSVRAFAPLTDCGAQLVFAQDPDISPLPTAPWVTTPPAANQQGTDCLLSAWENGKPAQLVVSEISDEADEIYMIYRLPGDGSVQVIVRVRSHPDQTVTWTQTTCRQLSLQNGDVTPADCQPETPIR